MLNTPAQHTNTTRNKTPEKLLPHPAWTGFFARAIELKELALARRAFHSGQGKTKQKEEVAKRSQSAPLQLL